MSAVPMAKFLAGIPWHLSRAWWRRTTYTEGWHELTVVPGPDGRPGAHLWLPGRPFRRPRVVAGGVRHDFKVVIDRHGSWMNGLCMGRTADRGEPPRSAQATLANYWETGWADLSPMQVEDIGGERAFRYRAVMLPGTLTEWQFARDGWLFMVGLLSRPANEAQALEKARRALDSWAWL